MLINAPKGKLDIIKWMRKTTNIPIKGIDSRESDNSAPDGLSTAIVDLEPIGSAGKITSWKPAARPTLIPITLNDPSYLEDDDNRIFRLAWERVKSQSEFLLGVSDVYRALSYVQCPGTVVLVLTSTTGTFSDNENVSTTSGTGNGTARYKTSSPRFIVTSGEFDVGDTITGGTSGATGVISTITGFQYRITALYLGLGGTGNGKLTFQSSQEWDLDIKDNEKSTLIVSNKGDQTDSRFFHLLGSTIFPAILPLILAPSNGFANDDTLISYTDEQIEANEYKGFLIPETEDKYIAYTFALKLKNGKFVSHTAPRVHKFEHLVPGAGIRYSMYLHTLRPSLITSGEWFEMYIKYIEEGGINPTDNFLEFIKNKVEGYYLFVTKSHISGEEASKDNLYYEYQSWSHDTLNIPTIDFAINEEELLTKRVLDVDPYSHHRISANAIGNYKNRVLLGGIYTDFGLPVDSFDAYATSSGTLNEADCYDEVTIKTDNGEFVRIATKDYDYKTAPTPDEFSFSDLISYPDARAVNYKIWVRDEGDTEYELALEVGLKEHSGLNIAFNYVEDRAVYGRGTSATTTASKDLTVNDVLMYEPNKVKVSDLEQLYFPLSQTYEVGDDNEEIVAFASNTDEVTPSQFGEFPIYIFKKSSIHAFEFSNSIDVLFQRVVTISNTYGLIHRDALAISNGVVFFGSGENNSGNIDDKGIHVLKGKNIEQIHLAIEYDDTYEFTSNSNYPNESKIVLGYDRSKEELYVSIQGSSDFPYSVDTEGNYVFNLKHNIWYKKGFMSSTADNKKALQFVQAYDSTTGERQLHFLSNSNTNSEDYRNISDEDSAVTNYISFVSRPIKFGNAHTYKRMFLSFLRGNIKTLTGKSYTVKLWGIRKGYSNVLVIHYVFDGATYPDVDDLVLKSNRGSFQSFVFTITGDILPSSRLEYFEFDYDIRSTNRLRE